MSDTKEKELMLTGLNEKQVADRVSRGETNEVPDSSAKSVADIIKENTLTYFNGIFLLLAILLVIAGSFKSLSFLPVIIGNTLIGIAQEIHAKKILDDIAVLHQSKSEVLRDGSLTKIEVSKLVRDDIIHLKAGDQIPADAVVVKGSLSVNESLLTGEADEIEKTPDNDKKLKSGSFVVSGDAYARLTHVGEDSYIAKLTKQAKAMDSTEQSEMIRSINILVVIAGVLIIPIGVTLFYQSYFVQGNYFSESIVSMVAAVIGMIPEGLYLLVSVALALSTVRLARNQVVLHDMKSIETLARVDVICVDKTGTITTDEMEVVRTASPIGAGMNAEEAESYLAEYIMALTDNNSTMEALKAYFASDDRVAEPVTFTITDTLAFSSKNKFSQVDTAQGVYRLGAPEFILSEEELSKQKELMERFASKGLRVIVFARKSEEAFAPLLFVVLKNGIRENVEETFAYFNNQGVGVRVISGDNPMTVSRIATQVGIPGADRYVNVSDLKTKEEIEEAAKKYIVFGRVKPEQKKELVIALQNQGKKVAMTGDGVNDILAMKEADCSIAMGGGSDAAMQASQVVLLDNDFGHMRQIVSEGRNNINNISRSATLFLVKNIFSIMLSVFSIINLMSYPLQPTQISLVSAFNIGIPAFFLALEKNDRKQSPHFLRNVLMKALPAAITDFLAIAALVVFGEVFGVSANDISVAATFLLAIVGFMILINISAPMNKYRVAVVAGCIAGIIFMAYYFHDLFAITTISTKAIMLFVVFAIATEPVMRYLTRMTEKLLALMTCWDEKRMAHKKAVEEAKAKKAEKKAASEKRRAARK